MSKKEGESINKLNWKHGLLAAAIILLGCGGSAALAVEENNSHIDRYGGKNYLAVLLMNKTFVYADTQEINIIPAIGCVVTNQDPNGDTYRVFSKSSGSTLVEYRDGSLKSAVGDLVCNMLPLTDQDRATVSALETGTYNDR